MSDVELRIPARPEYLSLVRAVVAAAASLEPRLGDDRIEDLRLVVSEATTNAIEAHVLMGSSDRISIRCDLADDRIEVEVEDHGDGFDLDDVKELPPVTDPSRLEFERGLGIPLMRVLADEHEIRSSDEGTAVRLVVYTSGRKATDE